MTFYGIYFIILPGITTSGLFSMDIQTKALKIQAIEGEKSIAHRSENMKLNPTLDCGLMDASQWDFSQILGKKRYITTLNVTNASTGILYDFRNNPGTALALFPSPLLSDYFTFCRYNLVFELEVQSHFQHQGALIMNVFPYLASGVVMSHIGINPTIFSSASRQERTIAPHDFITFGHDGNYKVVLPWTSNRNMLPTTRQSPATLGRSLNDYYLNHFQVTVFDPLQAVASAVGTSSIRIWARMEDISYSGYNPRY